MSATSFALVLLAALLHATWNALLKSADNRAAALCLISVGHVIVGATLAFFVPLPAIESWMFLFGSTIVHFTYYFLLFHSYRLGDLSQVYPIARGMAPVLIALGAQFFIGEALPLKSWIGISIVSLGIFLLSYRVILRQIPAAAVGAAAATGVMIAIYSLMDGIGVRQSQAALGYIAWLFILEIFIVLFFAITRRKMVFALSARSLSLGVTAGAISALAYGLVIYVKMSEPLGVVSTIRESSVIFAALIGILIFGERPWKLRLIAAIIVATGVILLALL